jgi:hypothetical protein
MSITSAKRTPPRSTSGDTATGARILTGKPSQKIGAVALAGAISTVLWTLLATYVATGMANEVVATLTGATTTILAFGLGYLIPD